MDRILTADAAVDAGSRLPEGLGTPAPAAADVARSLVSANLAGHDSHGLLRLPWYAEFVSDSRAVPTATPVVTTQSGATAAIDGRQGWGQLAGHLAVDTAAELAEQFGIGIVTAKRCNHIGRLGEYAELLAARGLISMLWCNADPSVAPFGGRIRMLGTDPFAAGIPGHLPLIIDFATAAVAEGKLRIERAAGHRVPLGLIQDAQGRPSTDPEDFYAGGALLPFGAHKGFGLVVLVELLGGALSGNHVGFLPEYQWGKWPRPDRLRGGGPAGHAARRGCPRGPTARRCRARHDIKGAPRRASSSLARSGSSSSTWLLPSASLCRIRAVRRPRNSSREIGLLPLRCRRRWARSE